jgi:hypothetical protein
LDYFEKSDVLGLIMVGFLTKTALADLTVCQEMGWTIPKKNLDMFVEHTLWLRFWLCQNSY